MSCRMGEEPAKELGFIECAEICNRHYLWNRRMNVPIFYIREGTAGEYVVDEVPDQNHLMCKKPSGYKREVVSHL